MQIKFKDFSFLIAEDGTVGLTQMYSNRQENVPEEFGYHVIPEFDVAGGSLSGRFKRRGSSETKALRYVSHEIAGNCLTMVQKNDKFQVTSVYQGYDDTNAIRVTQRYQNISTENQILTQANTFGFCFGKSI